MLVVHRSSSLVILIGERDMLSVAKRYIVYRERVKRELSSRSWIWGGGREVKLKKSRERKRERKRSSGSLRDLCLSENVCGEEERKSVKSDEEKKKKKNGDTTRIRVTTLTGNGCRCDKNRERRKKKRSALATKIIEIFVCAIPPLEIRARHASQTRDSRDLYSGYSKNFSKFTHANIR